MTILSLENGVTLECETLVRFVEGRRAVYKATLSNEPLSKQAKLSQPKQTVFAKVFSGKNFERYANRDKAGYTQLSAANILTPKLVLDTYLADHSVRVLCYQAIDITGSAEDHYYSLGYGEDCAASYQPRLALMKLVTSAVAEHHNANLLQTDLYLKNFLVKDNAVYTIDGDGIRRLFPNLFPWIRRRKKMCNLATLFSKMDVLDDSWIADLYEIYCKKTGITYSPFDYAEVYLLTQKIRHRVASGYADKKVFRSCTDVKVAQSFASYTALANGFNSESNWDIVKPAMLDDLLQSPEQRMKTGNTCTVGVAEMGSKQVVIKRYNIKNSLHALSRAFRLSRAAKSWANAHRLIISNIATPKPLALVEERCGWLRRRAYFLAEYLDAPDIAQFFTQATLEHKKIVAHEVALLFYKLYLLKLSHGDCKATNIKIVNSKPVLIDLDSMVAHTSTWQFKRKHVRDLKRLMRNWELTSEAAVVLKQAFVLQYNEEDILVLAGIV